MLDNKQCEAFMAVAETGSFEQAGSKLCITPSAVSLRVQALEKQLGQVLIIRARPCTLTQAGQDVLQHLQLAQIHERNLIQNLRGESPTQFTKISIAANADSLATWLLPVLKNVLIEEKIVTDIKIDDQSRTYALLETGIVNACISIQHQPMHGCVAEPLGKMHYQMVATKQFIQTWFPKGMNREDFRHAPAIVFNEKDQLHFDMLLKLFGLPQGSYPYYFIPSSDAFLNAIALGLGYGIVPTLQLQHISTPHDLVEIHPDARLELPLYWHHWQRQSSALNKLTQHLLAYARKILR